MALLTVTTRDQLGECVHIILKLHSAYLGLLVLRVQCCYQKTTNVLLDINL